MRATIRRPVCERHASPFDRVLGTSRGSHGRRDFDDFLATLGSVDLAEHAGCFADGWTDDWRFDATLRELAAALGYPLVFLWERYDGHDFSGGSELAVVCPDGALRSAPAALYDVVSGEADSYVVDASAVGALLAPPAGWEYQGDMHAVHSGGLRG